MFGKLVSAAKAAIFAQALADDLGVRWMGRVGGSIGTYEPPASRPKPKFTRHPGAKKNRHIRRMKLRG